MSYQASDKSSSPIHQELISNREGQKPPLFEGVVALSEREKLILDDQKRFLDLRDKWSFWIIMWISVFVTFHILLTLFIGLHWLDFTGNEWVVPTVIAEDFLQIVGMGYIVARFLYPNHQTRHDSQTH